MRHVSRLKSFIWYSTVALLVTLAVLVTVARLVISSVGEYRERIERLAGDYLGQPVTIESMDARMVGFKPSILLNDVSLREPETNEQLAHFSQISLALNPLSSLRQLSPIVDLSVSGANIVVIQRPDDSFQLQGVTLSEQARNTEAGGALGAWLLSQSRLALENSRVIWRNSKTGRDIVFNSVNIELQNISSRHRLNAAVRLPEELGKELRLSLDIRGNLLNRRDWAGDMYLKTVELKPADWLRDIEVQGLRFNEGNISLELWSEWQGGLLKGLQGELDLASMDVARNSVKLPLDRIAGQFRYRKDSDGWQLLVQKALLQEHGREVEPFRLHLEHQFQGGSSVRVRNMDIGSMMAFASHIPGLESGQRRQLQEMRPEGRLENLRVDLMQGKLLGVVAAFKQVKVAASGKLPGVEGLDASVRFDGSNAEMVIDSQQLALDLPQLFAKKLQLQKTTATVLASRLGEGWYVTTDQLAVSNNDIELNLAMALQLMPGEVPLIDLAGRFGNGRVRAVPDYLPVRIMPEGTVSWLNRAFVAGRVEDGSLLVHGMLDKSLLREEQGHFEVRFDTRDVTLDYQEGWPLVESIRGEARFSGLGMAIDTRSARLYQSMIGPTHIRIRRFKNPVLEIDGSVAASASDALRFLHESPLLDSADEVLAQMQAEGSAPLQLKMSLPLSARMKDVSPLAISGQVMFKENRLLVLKGVEFQALSGVLTFTESHFNAESITASTYGHPARIRVFTEQEGKPDSLTTVVAVQGHAAATALRESFSSPLLKLLEGDTDWQARLTLRRGEEGGVELDIYSSLDGMAVDLPMPLTKPQQGTRILSVSLGLAGPTAGVGTLYYGNAVKVLLQQDGLMGRLQRLAVLFDDKRKPLLPEQEAIHVSGTLDRFDVAQWREVFQHISSDEKSKRPLPIVLRMQRLHITQPKSSSGDGGAIDLTTLPRIDVLVRDFTYKDMPFGEVAMRVEPQARSVRIEDISVTAKNFTLKGAGRWRFGGRTTFTLDLSSANLGKMLKDLGFASVITKGVTRVKAKAQWLGSPLDVSLPKLNAEGHVKIEEGTIKDVKAGAGKLLGLLSLQALPRRLFLDFSDLSEEGLQFSAIEGNMEIRNGNAYTEDLVVKSLPADVLVTGRTGLVTKDFDQLVVVVPNVSDTVSVAGALAWGPQVAAALVVLQKIFKSDIDAATMTRYTITGSWEDPVIDKLEPLPLEEKEQE